MNRDRLLKRKEKAVVDLELYDACSEIFRLLRDNHITSITLDKLSVSQRKIRKKFVYTTKSDGEWHAWTTIATQGITGNVLRPLHGLHQDTKKEFVQDYQEKYRQLLREEVYQRNGKIVETVHKTR